MLSDRLGRPDKATAWRCAGKAMPRSSPTLASESISRSLLLVGPFLAVPRQWGAAREDRRRTLVKWEQDRQDGGDRCGGEADRAVSGMSGQDVGEAEDTSGVAVHDLFLPGFVLAHGG